MIAVLFEIQLKEGQQSQYLDLATELRPTLEQIDGFISIERFQSLTNSSRLLSLSFWQDEAAVKRWRQLEAHRDAQTVGRRNIFKDYRLRVASILRDYSMTERDQAPEDSLVHHSNIDTHTS